ATTTRLAAAAAPRDDQASLLAAALPPHLYLLDRRLLGTPKTRSAPKTKPFLNALEVIPRTRVVQRSGRNNICNPGLQQPMRNGTPLSPVRTLAIESCLIKPDHTCSTKHSTCAPFM
ncbi:unnamed protein product, partial [Ectocarpus sp. 4 AP-2014]